MTAFAVPESVFFPLPFLGRWELSGKRFTTTATFLYTDRFEGKRLDIIVAADVTTDFNSTPRVVWWWFPPSECPAAGLVHDRLYERPYVLLDGELVRLTRAQCDEVHRMILVRCGCRASKAWAAHKGLRAGGWNAWRKYRNRERRAA